MLPPRLRRLGPVGLIIGCLSVMSEAEDWPRFLGPRGNGTSAETNLLDRFPAAGPPVVWRKEIGPGYGAPSVRGQRLVFHDRVLDEEVIECVATTSGSVAWRYSYPSRFQDPYGYNNGPRCTPWLTTNRCYTLGAEGRLVCLDLATGKPVWQRELARDWNIPEAFFGIGSSPVLAGDRLLVMAGGHPDAGMVALDPETGKTIWENVGEKTWTGQPKRGWPGTPTVVWSPADKQASYSTPVVAEIHGRLTAFCLMRQGLVSLDPQTGAVNFVRWFRAQVEESVNAASPVVVDDLVLISAAYYKVGSVLMQVAPNGRAFEEVWKGTSLEAHWSTPVVHDGFLYGFSGRNEPDARFRCVELRTGTVRWERDERWTPHSTKQPDTYGRGSCILADGKLIVLGEGGLLGLFRPTPEMPEELARWQAPPLEHPCWAAPVLADGHLYLRSEHYLICLDLRRH